MAVATAFHGRLVSVAVTGLVCATVLAACGNDATRTSGSTPTGAVTSTTTPRASPVSEHELERAEQVVRTFVDALGRGDVDAAATTIGPVSERRASASGGLESLLTQSTEGHGAWGAAANRRSTPIGFGPGLAVVVLEGTLQVEGSSEHRVAAFPTRKAESADVWFVEPWAYDLDAGPPLRVIAPQVDDEEWARFAPRSNPEVVVSADGPGTVRASFDADRPLVQLSEGGRAGFEPDIPLPSLVTVLYEHDSTLAATGFAVRPT